MIFGSKRGCGDQDTAVYSYLDQYERNTTSAGWPAIKTLPDPRTSGVSNSPSHGSLELS